MGCGLKGVREGVRAPLHQRSIVNVARWLRPARVSLNSSSIDVIVHEQCVRHAAASLSLAVLGPRLLTSCLRSPHHDGSEATLVPVSDLEGPRLCP